MLFSLFTFLLFFLLPFSIVIFWHKRPVLALIFASVLGGFGPAILKPFRVYQQMIDSGQGDPELMSGMITESIISSILGLVFLVPLLIFVQWASRRLRNQNALRTDIKSKFE